MGKADRASIPFIHGLERLNMSSYSLSNILLPAVCVSSAVFSTLTVPFALIKSEPVAIELPFYSGEIQPIFDGQHKEVAIPYIGFSIVVSVGAGMATVEVMRRWNQFRESALLQEEESNSQDFGLSAQSKADEPENIAPPEELTLPEYRPSVASIDLPPLDDIFNTQPLATPSSTPETEDVMSEAAPTLVEFQPTPPHQSPELSASHRIPNLSLVPPADNVVQLELQKASHESTSQEIDLIWREILESREQYQTCRIQVPHLKRRVFAIALRAPAEPNAHLGQYYSFLRAEKTKEKVLEVLAKLGDRVGKTVVTKTEKGYTIWALESEVS